MANDSGILRSLRDIQRSVPDRDFFVHNKLLGAADGEKKKKGGFFSGSGFIGGKKRVRLDVEHAREQVKAFHNSFMAVKRSGENGKGNPDQGKMSIAAMNEYRNKIRTAAESDDAEAAYLALDAIIKFIDLKNSGMMADKQPILQDCLKKIGFVLHTDGGISMFHTTWFLTVYREYLARFKMFPRGEYAVAQREGSAEAQAIAKRLQRKQFEIPHYLDLVNEKNREVRLLNQYSNEEAVKRSVHGQRGCSWEEIKTAFQDRCKDDAMATTKPGQINTVAILMAYALVYARIPMLSPAVEIIRNLIPAVNLDGILYRQKIVIAQKINLLEIARGLYQNDGTPEYQKKLFLLAESVYKYCVRVIADNNLERIQAKSEIHVHPILKQAVILITYKNIFRTQLDAYLGALNKSKELLQTVKGFANSGHKAMQQLAEHAAIYEKNLDNIIHQVKSEAAAGYKQSDFGESHQNW